MLEAIVARIPPPKPRDTDRLQALIIDSWFDNYLGVVSLVRVMQGEIKPRDKVLVMSTGRAHEVDQVGVFTPKRTPRDKLAAGEVGWVTAAIKDVHGAPVGDTLTQARDPAPHPLPGFQKMQPRVFAGLFPVVADDYPARARGAGQTQAQRRVRCTSNRKPPRRWDSASAAASSAFCTWTSCRSGSSASTISI